MTHYTCGVTSYNSMKRGLVRTCIEDHKTVYSVGLAGPDFFFYSLGEMARPGVNLGSIIHKYRCGAFLKNMYEEVMLLHGEARVIGIAYLAGFLGHYELDAACHPFVFKVAKGPDRKKALGKHFAFEAAMDVMITERYLHKNINQSQQVGLVKLKDHERTVICAIISGAFRKTFPDCAVKLTRKRLEWIFREYYLITCCLIDPSGFKEFVVRNIERKINHGWVTSSPLLINNNTYGVSSRLFKRFDTCFKKGVEDLMQILEVYEDTLGGEVSKEDFFLAIGNKSYHTGREPEKVDG